METGIVVVLCSAFALVVGFFWGRTTAKRDILRNAKTGGGSVPEEPSGPRAVE